jgi:carbon storage regulator
MLILWRRVGERIVIDGQIEVTVLNIRNGTVRLGVTAPRSVRVLREAAVRPAEISTDPVATALGLRSRCRETAALFSPDRSRQYGFQLLLSLSVSSGRIDAVDEASGRKEALNPVNLRMSAAPLAEHLLLSSCSSLRFGIRYPA